MRIRTPAVKTQLTQWAEQILNLQPRMAHNIANWRGGANAPLTIVMCEANDGTVGQEVMKNILRNINTMKFQQVKFQIVNLREKPISQTRYVQTSHFITQT